MFLDHIAVGNKRMLDYRVGQVVTYNGHGILLTAEEDEPDESVFTKLAITGLTL